MKSTQPVYEDYHNPGLWWSEPDNRVSWNTDAWNPVPTPVVHPLFQPAPVDVDHVVRMSEYTVFVVLSDGRAYTVDVYDGNWVPAGRAPLHEPLPAPSDDEGFDLADTIEASKHTKHDEDLLNAAGGGVS